MQQRFQVRVPPLQLGDKADNPVQIHHAAYCRADPDQSITTGRLFLNQLMNLPAQPLEILLEALPFDWDRGFCTNPVCQIRHRDLDMGDIQIHRNTIAGICLLGQHDRFPASRRDTHGGFHDKPVIQQFLHNS